MESGALPHAEFKWGDAEVSADAGPSCITSKSASLLEATRLFCLLVAAVCLNNEVAAGTAISEARGDCSQAFSQVSVGRDLIIQCNVDRRGLTAIADQLKKAAQQQNLTNAQFSALVNATNTIIDSVVGQLGTLAADAATSRQSLENIERLLTQRLLPGLATKQPEDVTKEAQEWKARFDDLLNTFTGTTVEDTQAREAIARLDLNKAGEILDALLAKQAPALKAAARREFARGEVYALQARPKDSLQHYSKAYALEPENVDYTFAYADALWSASVETGDSNQREHARNLFEELLPRVRKLALTELTYRVRLVRSTSTLADIYESIARPEDVVRLLEEATQTRLLFGPPQNLATLLTEFQVRSKLAAAYERLSQWGNAQKVFRDLQGIAKTARVSRLSRIAINGHAAAQISRLAEASQKSVGVSGIHEQP
jgi:tetratricopeptide (TPR) repeat protein